MWEPTALNGLHAARWGLLPDYRSRRALLPARWVLQRPHREGAGSSFSFGLGQMGSGKGGWHCARMGVKGRDPLALL